MREPLKGGAANSRHGIDAKRYQTELFALSPDSVCLVSLLLLYRSHDDLTSQFADSSAHILPLPEKQASFARANFYVRPNLVSTVQLAASQ